MSTTQQTGQQNGSEKPAGKKPRGRPFTGKDDPRLRQNLEAARAAAGPAQEEAPGGEDVSLYEAMRHVFTQPKEADRTQPQRECRAWLKADRKNFMAKLADLEKAALAKGQSVAAPGGAVAGKDEGSERVGALLDEQIAAHEAEQAEEDAKLAARPGAAALGADRQAELRAALWDERQLWKQVRALERDGEADYQSNWMRQIERDLSESLHASLRTRDLELAVHPEPGKVVGSLQRAVEGTRERTEQLHKKLAWLEQE
jgi:hypothetical protein